MEQAQEMTKKIDPELKTIGEYLKKETGEKNMVFVIPEYQRGYSWKIEHCDKLWQDIEDFIKSGANDPYFFGTIIVDCSEESKSKFHLIDGQQRTTPFILLLKALLLRMKETLDKIKDKEDEDNRKFKKGFERRYENIICILYNTDDDGIIEILDKWDLVKDKIFLENHSINEEFKEELKNIIDAESFDIAEKECYKFPRKQKDNKYTNFFKNFKFFYEKLGNYGEIQLNSFAENFLNKCQVIEIRSWQLGQAITMFNSLNSKGMALSDADIISAQLYSNIQKDKQEDRKKFNETWGKIKTTISTELSSRKIINLDSVLQQYMYITRSVRAKDDESFKRTEYYTTPGLRNYYTNINKELLEQPIDLCNNLLKIAQIWDLIKDCPIVKLLLKFNENAKIYLISYLNRYEIENINKSIVLNITECLLRLFVVLELVDKGFSSTEFKSFLFSENIKLVDNQYSIDDIKDDFNQHISKYWKIDSIKQSILDYEKNAIVFLNEYLYIKEKNKDKKFKGKKKFKFADNVNIEHIMPASGKNLEIIRTDAGIETKEDFNALVNQIGNKILLEENINKSIGNEWFRTKKQHSVNNKTGYKDSSYAIASDLVDYEKDTWTKDDIENASEKAANRISNFIFDIQQNS